MLHQKRRNMLGTVKITYKGKTHTVRFNIAARFFLLSKLGGTSKEMSEALANSGIFAMLRTITYAGIVGWAEQNMEEPSMTEKEVAEYLGTAPDDKIAELFEEFNKWYLGEGLEEKKSPAKDRRKPKN